MQRTIKAKVIRGAIKPLQRLELDEGETMIVTVTKVPKKNDVLKSLKSTAGAWKGTHDPEELKRHIYADRLVKTRPGSNREISR